MRIFFAYALLSLIMVSCAAGANIDAFTDRLNFWEPATHEIHVMWNGTENVDIVASLPEGFELIENSACSMEGRNITCLQIRPNQSLSFGIISPEETEGSTFGLKLTAKDGSNEIDSAQITFIRIQDVEIFNTLVEYGRAQGNYFLDTKDLADENASVCPYVPASKDFELNFIHRIYNLKSVFGLESGDIGNATFYCEYPYHTIVRKQNTEILYRSDDAVNAYFSVRDLESNRFRIGSIGLTVSDDDYTKAGGKIRVGCSNISYEIPKAHGRIWVDSSSFDLEARSIRPFTGSVTPNISEIRNGVSVVPIDYEFTFNETYRISNVAIEIKAPAHGRFLEVEGNQLGPDVRVFNFNRKKVEPGEVMSLSAVVQIDTADAEEKLSSVDAMYSVRGKFIPCWEENAYRKSLYEQKIEGSARIAVDMSVPYEGLSTEPLDIDRSQPGIATDSDAKGQKSGSTNMIANTAAAIAVILAILIFVRQRKRRPQRSESIRNAAQTRSP